MRRLGALLQAAGPRATVAAGTAACTATFGVPCLSATRAAIAVRSNVVRIVIPRRR